ncbi:MAG TPA: multidrug ABC transporter permease, partial [Pseudacidobacterium sp.]|nr:multidrug ABC transporter permease [Pseudacidobacterium sp.]
MATAAATASVPRALPSRNASIWTAAYTLWEREIVRFYRQKARVVGVIASPLLFWFVLGSGFAHSFRSGNTGSDQYLGYFFPGAVVMIVL